MVPSVLALNITEIMYNPGSSLGGNYNEWVEVYSNSEIDLTNYKINGKNFDDITINNEYLIIAENTDKFEEFFGDNNSIWDEGYKLVDATSFSLDDAGGIVNISDGIEEVIVSYVDDFGDGNGNSIEFFNGSWVESLNVGGTPGSGRVDEDVISVRVEVTEELPEIFSIEIFPDESDEAGIQIFPEPGINKEIMVRVNASDYDYILVEIDNEVKNTTYETNFSFSYYKQAGIYQINVSVFRGNLANTQIIDFEYMELIAFDFFPNEIDFNQVAKGGQSNEEFINLENQGNVVLDFSLNSDGLNNGETFINSSNFENGYDGNWSSFNEMMDVNLDPNDFDEIQLRLNVPVDSALGVYTGVIDLLGIKG